MTGTMTYLAAMRATPGQPGKYDVTVLVLGTTTRPAIDVVCCGREFAFVAWVSDALNYLFGDRTPSAAIVGKKALDEGGEVAVMAREIAAQYGVKGEEVEIR